MLYSERVSDPSEISVNKTAAITLGYWRHDDALGTAQVQATEEAFNRGDINLALFPTGRILKDGPIVGQGMRDRLVADYPNRSEQALLLNDPNIDNTQKELQAALRVLMERAKISEVLVLAVPAHSERASFIAELVIRDFERQHGHLGFSLTTVNSSGYLTEEQRRILFNSAEHKLLAAREPRAWFATRYPLGRFLASRLPHDLKADQETKYYTKGMGIA